MVYTVEPPTKNTLKQRTPLYRGHFPMHQPIDILKKDSLSIVGVLLYNILHKLLYPSLRLATCRAVGCIFGELLNNSPLFPVCYKV